jgi:hypothetical protein
MRRTKLTRRSFLGRVAGGALTGALAVLAQPADAHPISDNDPSDGVGRGRSSQAWPYSDTDLGGYGDRAGRAGRLGHFNDTDSGATGDRHNHGRRITDGDSRDPANYRPNISDRDQGQFEDAPGRGRRPRRR